MKKTSQRSLLFRQNVGRTEEEWAHFLDGYRQCAFTSAGVYFWAGAKEAGMKGCAGGTADIFAKHGEIAAKMKSALGPGTTISRTALMCRCRDAGLRGPLERTLK